VSKIVFSRVGMLQHAATSSRKRTKAKAIQSASKEVSAQREEYEEEEYEEEEYEEEAC
jgi:hypothetical protein